MKTPRSSVRLRYPVTASALPLGGTVLKLFLDRHPAPYVSRGRKVHRWPVEPVRVFEALWGITGRCGASLQIVPVNSRTNQRTLRAYGSYHQMHTLRDQALRIWHTLPGGQEIETLFARMFPREIQLEADETIDKTKS